MLFICERFIINDFTGTASPQQVFFDDEQDAI